VVVYEHGAWCYGGCGRIPLSELGLHDVARPAALPPTDVEGELARIALLPEVSVRGLSLPADGDSYYLVWPGARYYKRRKFFPGDGPKYICPRGHSKPLYLARPEGSALAIVEGELNALSIANVTSEFAVCSPGGVGDFNEKTLEKNWAFFSSFSRFLIVTDKDRPGLEAAKKLKPELLRISPYVRTVLMEPDANELLQAGKLAEVVQGWSHEWQKTRM
jgi:hypothetical protein